jgi:hypothetical protein
MAARLCHGADSRQRRRDGLAALWRGVAQGRPYPLALLDGRMPDIDGLALTAKIREQAELSATRIILMTSGDCQSVTPPTGRKKKFGGLTPWRGDFTPRVTA